MLRSLPCRLPPPVLVRTGDPFGSPWQTLLGTFLHQACRGNNGSLQPLADSAAAGASASAPPVFICRDPADFREGVAACLDPKIGFGRNEMNPF